jgi:hypothetical protein
LPTDESKALPRLIKTLDLVLGDEVDFEIDKSFNQDLPLQIHCRSCGTHLEADWRYGRLVYRHPRERYDWCRAIKTFVVIPHVILREALRAVLEKAPAEPTEAIRDRLYKWVRAVHVEAVSYDVSLIYVDIIGPEERRAA